MPIRTIRCVNIGFKAKTVQLESFGRKELLISCAASPRDIVITTVKFYSRDDEFDH